MLPRDEIELRRLGRIRGCFCILFGGRSDFDFGTRCRISGVVKKADLSGMARTGSHSDVNSHNRGGAPFNYGVIKYAHDGRKNARRIVNCFRERNGRLDRSLCMLDSFLSRAIIHNRVTSFL